MPVQPRMRIGEDERDGRAWLMHRHHPIGQDLDEFETFKIGCGHSGARTFAPVEDKRHGLR
jgi:hypothetical protein